MSQVHFYLYKIFKDGAKITISEGKIAKLYGITIEEAREYIQKDVQAKMFLWEHSTSTFFLLGRGFEFLYCMRREELGGN